jgi:DNA-binding NarL/FixJ family response regulator
MSETNISIVLIDDNPLLLEGLETLIREQPGFNVIVASANIIEVLHKVREAKPRVVLVDVGLHEDDSLRLTATIHAEVPDAKVIVMGLLPQHEDVADFVGAGASGFLMKDASLDDFVSTIRLVASGTEILPGRLTGSLFSQIVTRAIAGEKSPVLEAVRLTQRERHVVELLGEGLSSKEIAARLHVALHSVRSDVRNVLEKLALHARLEVAAFTVGGGQDLPVRAATSEEKVRRSDRLDRTE